MKILTRRDSIREFMTKAEREMVLFLINDGGADLCQKCIHLGKPSCGRYVSPTDYSKECSDDYCIDGMVKYFENLEKNILTDKLEEIMKKFCIGSLEAVCGVGDTIYIPWVWFGEFGIAEVEITGMCIDDEGLRYCFNFDEDEVDLEDERFLMEYKEIYSYHFGAKWFLDKAKAEVRLEELRAEAK